MKTGLAESTLKKRKWLLEDKLYPAIGTLPVKEISPPQILRALRKIEDTGNIETANRAKQVASQVFRYAVAQGITEVDPTRDLKGALSPSKARHFSAITKPSEVAKLIKDIRQYDGTPVVNALLRISPLLFQRPGEIRQMEWKEVNFEQAQWEIPEEKTKMRIEHIVPLAKQSIEILEELKPFTFKRSKYVFPSQGNSKKPTSDAAVNKALRLMGYGGDQMTAHGFRAMARTILDEVLDTHRI